MRDHLLYLHLSVMNVHCDEYEDDYGLGRSRKQFERKLLAFRHNECRRLVIATTAHMDPQVIGFLSIP